MSNFINQDKSACCGCTACAHICGHKAITMQPDGMGFLYPQIDLGKCTKCGLCEKVCAFHENYPKDGILKEPDVYAVRHKKIKEIEKSRSGAMFVSLSDWILERGGTVYGAGYVEHFKVVHKRAVTSGERNEFRGSKYVQSDLNTVFVQIKEDLRNGRFVLFSGTPCQTAGLRSYLSLLRVGATKLYVVDIVCHGVPSPFFWRDYLAYVERKHSQIALSVDFRNKSNLGWGAHKESFKFKEGIVYAQAYAYTFNQHITFRHSCGVCYFTNFHRPSDITIADFWGWERVDPLFNLDDKGVSLVLVNSVKGRFLFEVVKETLHYIKTDQSSCVQPNLQYPSVIHSRREDFEKDYVKYGFAYVGRKYALWGLSYHIHHLGKKVKSRILNKIKK